MERSTSTLPLRTTLCAALSLISASSFADDGKMYPGTLCQGSLVGNPPITSYEASKLTNTSATNSAVVVCPVVRDSVFSTTGANEAYLRYYKGTSTGMLATLYSYSAYGTSVYSQFKSDFGAPGYRSFNFSPIASYSQGYYSFVVVIPPGEAGAKSSVISYRLDEN